MAEDDRTPGGRRTRRGLAVAGALMALLAAAIFAGIIEPGDGGEAPPRLPEAGSRFREQPRAAAPQRAPLLDVLAPVLAAAGEAPAGPATNLAPERVAAQLVAIGTDDASAALRREWGAVVVRGALPRIRRIGAALARRTRRTGRLPVLLAAEPATLVDQPALGAEPDGPAEARLASARAARVLRRAGVRMVLAPSLDLAVAGGPAEERSFGEEPADVALLARAATAGFRAGGVLPAPGRFPGEGAASQDPLAGAASVGLGREELLARDVRPFTAVAGAVPAMQMSAAVYAAFDSVTPATLLPDAVALLRRGLRFDGAVVSADLVAASAVGGQSIGATAVQALRAGNDLLLVSGGPAEQDAAVSAILDALRAGRLDPRRVEEALARVFALKRAAGLPVGPDPRVILPR